MTEERSRLHDAIVKWLTLALAIGGFVVALNTYVFQQNESRNQNERFEQGRLDQAKKEADARDEEYKRRLWEKQLDMYLQACKAASTIATVEDQKHPDYGPARVRFDQLYHGELCVVESPKVEGCMVSFRNAMLEFERSHNEEDRKKLRNLSLQLAHACRESTESVWNVALGKLLPSKP